MTGKTAEGQGHLVYVVDDDPVVAELVAEIIRSRGDRVRVFSNVEDALAAFAEEEPCYGVLDQQLPANARSKTALVSAGERLVEGARAVNARYHGRWHVMQLIVLSGYATDADFAIERLELGADAFVAKPLDDAQIKKLTAKIKVSLDRTGRTHHADCARCVREATGERAAVGLPPGVAAQVAPVAVPATAAPVSAAPRLVIDGIKVDESSAVTINGETRTMMDSTFVSILKLVATQQHRPGSWMTSQALGFARNRAMSTLVRDVFKGLVPEGFQVLLGDKAGSFRLNPAIVIERVEWAALEEHPNAGVKKLAREMRGRGK